MARRLADAGIAVTVLPATDLYLMGRDQDHAVRRGVADANFLGAHGVNCSLSTNNILNPATPYGDCSLIRMANLHANVLQIAAPAQLRELFLMLTERSARLLNLTDYGLAVGNPADIVVIDAETPEQAVAEIRPPLAVWKRGRQTVIRHPPELAAASLRLEKVRPMPVDKITERLSQPGSKAIERLRDGTEIRLRPLRAEDDPLLRRPRGAYDARGFAAADFSRRCAG